MAEKLFSGSRRQEDKSLLQRYVVKKGDTLAKIAKELGRTVEELAKANGIGNVDAVKEGQVLIVPKKEEKKEKIIFTKAKKK